MIGLSVRNSARQIGHQVAKYIIKTGRPAAAKSDDVITLPSARCMAKAGGVSPTLVPTGADGVGGAVVAVGAGVLVGGGAVAVGWGVGHGVGVAVGCGVAVGRGVAVGKGVGVGHGVAVGRGVGVAVG